MEANNPTTQTLRLASTSSECNRLYKFLERFVFEHKIPDKTLHDLKLAAEEVVANIINHAYKNAPDQAIEITISAMHDQIQICFTDDAIACNPLEFGTNDDREKDLCSGGMGLQIIRSITDSQTYERIDNRNVLTITKHYNN
jgi:serine/threonine-protein kinase RsbW